MDHSVSTVPARDSQPVLLRVLALSWLANAVLGTFFGRAYLADLPPAQSLHIFLYAHLGLVSSILTLTLPVCLINYCLARLLPRWIAPVQALTWMLFHIALYIDTRVWALYQYHLNGAAWNLLTTPGGEDAFRLNWPIWRLGLALGLALFLGELLVWRALHSYVRVHAATPRRLARPALLLLAVVLAPVCIEKTIYAAAEMEGDREVAAVSQIFPMYARLALTPLLPEVVRERIALPPVVDLRPDEASLDYPRTAPAVDALGPRPNILMLLVDSWRADMLDGEVMPNLEHFAAGARRFEDHVSGGNATRFGVFSLLYGLPGTYWWPVLREHRTPVLIDVLLELGYDVRVFASASMEYPEFRSTAWSRVEDRVRDDYLGRKSERDEAVGRDFVEWRRSAAEDGEERPWFAFVLLDSAHQTYDFPDGAGGAVPFEPYTREVDYLELASSEDPALVLRVKNRYKNALHHADRVAGRMLAELAGSGELERTLVVVTGDHGEEFAENGHWGHTSNFTPEQVSVPFLIRGPGIEPGVETRPTSHVDVAGTLLCLLGADARSMHDWTLGLDLRSPPEERRRVVASWDAVGLLTPAGILRVPMARSPGFEQAAYDRSWRLLADQAQAFESEEQALEQLAQDCVHFLRPPDHRREIASAVRHDR